MTTGGISLASLSPQYISFPSVCWEYLLFLKIISVFEMTRTRGGHWPDSAPVKGLKCGLLLSDIIPFVCGPCLLCQWTAVAAGGISWSRCHCSVLRWPDSTLVNGLKSGPLVSDIIPFFNYYLLFIIIFF